MECIPFYPRVTPPREPSCTFLLYLSPFLDLIHFSLILAWAPTRLRLYCRVFSPSYRMLVRAVACYTVYVFDTI